MLPVLLAMALGLQNPAPTPKPVPPAEAPKAPALSPLSFASKRFPYHWDATLPVNLEVDGLKISTIFFNRREFRGGPLKGADFGTRAEVEVTNASKHPKVPGFSVAVFDSEDRLLGVASGGASLVSLKPDDTKTYDLNFHFVTERLPLGSYFVLSMELGE
jgi:hypothetical protein